MTKLPPDLQAKCDEMYRVRAKSDVHKPWYELGFHACYELMSNENERLKKALKAIQDNGNYVCDGLGNGYECPNYLIAEEAIGGAE